MFDPLELSWLPRPPDDFRQRVRALQPGDAKLGESLLRLAAHRLDSVQAGALGRAIGRLRAAGADLAPLSPFRLSILSNATVDLIADALPAAAARHGVSLEVALAPFDQVLQQTLDPNSELHRSAPDAVLLLVDHRFLDLATPTPGLEHRISTALEKLTEVLDGLGSSAPVIVQTIGMPAQPLFGSYDRRIAGTARDVDAVNSGIVSLAAARGHYVLDVATLCETVGSARFHDAVAWNHYKLPMAHNVVPLFADWVGRLLGAVRGKTRKCLVLDLDNTLWGGVIGDDGMEGIRIGQGSAEGEAFLSVQRLAMDLKNRGIMLAVSSKNEEATARAVFASHPDMLLRETDITVFQANWLDKASNIEAIAQALNIGVDAMVLLDDNGAERAQVRAALPMVAVPEIGNDAALYPALLTAAGYFEAVAFSEEDRTRVESYATNTLRAEVKAKARSLEDYLGSLEMTIQHAEFDKLNRARIAQLINKSNQFNLTTRRYSEAAVAAMEAEASTLTVQTRLADRFGDFGIIGVIIARRGDSDIWDIDSWLMSCRVLGRQVEAGMLDALIAEVRKRGGRSLTATYIPTAKNMMVAEHFDNLGFARTSADPDGTVHYHFDLVGYATPNLPFQVPE